MRISEGRRWRTAERKEEMSPAVAFGGKVAEWEAPETLRKVSSIGRICEREFTKGPLGTAFGEWKRGDCLFLFKFEFYKFGSFEWAFLVHIVTTTALTKEKFQGFHSRTEVSGK
jgi:hypothetical protein